jgi:hypothetical protein
VPPKRERLLIAEIDAKKPWAISRANTYRGAALPKGANTGGATLGGRSHGRTRTDHNQRANSFGPNELRAIATSGDTMPFVWDFQLEPSHELEGPRGEAPANDPPVSQLHPEL